MSFWRKNEVASPLHYESRLLVRTANRLCVTNVTGLLLAFFVAIFSNINVFWSFTKDLFKGKWSLAESYLNKIIVTLVTQGLLSVLSSPVLVLAKWRKQDVN